MAETKKAFPRRVKEGFFENYCQGEGIDIGVGRIGSSDGEDPLLPHIRRWDKDDGDATYMHGVSDQYYNFVYSSHLLEHLDDPWIGLNNQWRILKPEGYLIIFLPDRDLYEKKKTKPSRWNSDHRHFFLLDQSESPDTLSALNLVKESIFKKEYQLIYAKRCDEGHTITDPEIHSDGEYSIEIVLQKNR